MDEVATDAGLEDPRPRFSLLSGEGDGAMLGLAAGDTAGGAWELGYSAVTEQAIIIAYELIEKGTIEDGALVRALCELDGSEAEEPVYRAESLVFRAWLDGAAAGAPVISDAPSLDSVARVVPIGVHFRKDPQALMRESLAVVRLFDRHISSIAAALVAAAATAASCFAQTQRDLVAGVRETVVPFLTRLDAGSPVIPILDTRMEAIISAGGAGDGATALTLVEGAGDETLELTMAAIALLAGVDDRFHSPVEQAARIGGSSLAAFVGAAVGARMGIRAWPWVFANDTWFAEIGRRLVRGPSEVRDLPIPYAVEQHLMFGLRPGFH
jgi:ADP-ribosylglycohydrolase